MATRRETLAWLMRALAAGGALAADGCEPHGAAPAVVKAAGYGRDPNLLKPIATPWPLTLDAGQKKTVTRLADLLLPADEHSPAASALGVPDFVDEWISAPYPEQAGDRELVLWGLGYLDRAAGASFAAAPDAQAGRILDRIADPRAAEAKAHRFFCRVRRICLIGFHTTPEGAKALGYVGDQPSLTFPDPPPVVLARLNT